ncbi:hypothetical protein NOR_02437 [Metarhizium rileyi]|uniref:Uncharacterized protein n=1 Tax=Metarhizium rileyi (strain RCEF 4871) TaxID=1649241 RepID=A0A167HIG9_METRR|nr:hypothetical protein NOR_02437 [Metarhizium rileyi RCEF 4871]TWU76283.1 hypothetical protein ED733_005386 [Metarhizium rileyi]
MAMVHQDTRYASDSAGDDDVSMNISFPAYESAYPSFPPPPAPTASIGKKRAHKRPPPRPVDKIPALPLPPKSPIGLGLLGPPFTAAKPKRKTILQRIDGWWDLGLLEKRQTLLGKHG